jgi:ubiquinone/menaquinone biosynthesis C-methylase UbiE
MPAYTLMNDAEPDFAVYAIDAAIDMLMQKRDKIEKRELH